MAHSSELLDAISSANIDDQALQEALRRILLTPVDEGISFWTDIVGSELFTDVHRSRCYLMLFRRHVKPGMRASVLLDRDRVCEWINIEEAFKVSGTWPPPMRHGIDAIVFQSMPAFVICEPVGHSPSTRAAVYFRTLEQPENDDRFAKVGYGWRPGYPFEFVKRATFPEIGIGETTF
ncbi:MAG TPA: hypothetical protein VHY91_06325 [Pirellulales bacterium]|jgi:hypothetical protein|nr:hypothetical protein [Pirellulales bacterium]